MINVLKINYGLLPYRWALFPTRDTKLSDYRSYFICQRITFLKYALPIYLGQISLHFYDDSYVNTINS